jgi:hypothetical protein
MVSFVSGNSYYQIVRVKYITCQAIIVFLPSFLEVFLLKPSWLSQTFIISPTSPEKERDEGAPDGHFAHLFPLEWGFILDRETFAKPRLNTSDAVQSVMAKQSTPENF